MVFIKYPSHVNSHGTAKNLIRKHVMSPTKFTITQTTNDHFDISDVSRHAKRPWPITNSAGVTKLKFIILQLVWQLLWQLTCEGVCGVNNANYDRNLLMTSRTYNLHIQHINYLQTVSLHTIFRWQITEPMIARDQGWVSTLLQIQCCPNPRVKGTDFMWSACHWRHNRNDLLNPDHCTGKQNHGTAPALHRTPWVA